MGQAKEGVNGLCTNGDGGNARGSQQHDVLGRPAPEVGEQGGLARAGPAGDEDIVSRVLEQIEDPGKFFGQRKILRQLQGGAQALFRTPGWNAAVPWPGCRSPACRVLPCPPACLQPRGLLHVLPHGLPGLLQVLPRVLLCVLLRVPAHIPCFRLPDKRLSPLSIVPDLFLSMRLFADFCLLPHSGQALAGSGLRTRGTRHTRSDQMSPRHDPAARGYSAAGSSAAGGRRRLAFFSRGVIFKITITRTMPLWRLERPA